MTSDCFVNSIARNVGSTLEALYSDLEGTGLTVPYVLSWDLNYLDAARNIEENLDDMEIDAEVRALIHQHLGRLQGYGQLLDVGFWAPAWGIVMDLGLQFLTKEDREAMEQRQSAEQSEATP